MPVVVRLANKKSSAFAELFIQVAVRTGLEPATPCVTGRYSNQLNYRTNWSANLLLFLRVENILMKFVE
jgi:hypothetical protein